jgi:hypothetical protein
MLGLSPRVPKFVKRFGDLGPSIELAVKNYAEDVRARPFPQPGPRLPNAENQGLARFPDGGHWRPGKAVIAAGIVSAFALLVPHDYSSSNMECPRLTAGNS